MARNGFFFFSQKRDENFSLVVLHSNIFCGACFLLAPNQISPSCIKVSVQNLKNFLRLFVVRQLRYFGPTFKCQGNELHFDNEGSAAKRESCKVSFKMNNEVIFSIVLLLNFIHCLYQWVLLIANLK